MNADALNQVGEFQLISRIKEWLPPESPNMILGIGDDSSIVDVSGESRIVCSIDTMVEGRHFDTTFMTMAQIGYRLAVGNVSDMAAMGAVPEFALISCALPSDLILKDVKNFYGGISDAAGEYGFEIIGGDTVSTEGKTVFTMAMIGRLRNNSFKTRSGTRPGDIVMVTGYPGQARTGLCTLQGKITLSRHASYFEEKFLHPVARVNESLLLVQHSCVHTMMDISDGLTSDLRRICEASGVGVMIEEKQLPFRKESEELCADLGLSRRECVLYGGEDFELLITVDALKSEPLKTEFEEKANVPLTAIGRITGEEGRFICRCLDGTLQDVSDQGWDHFTHND